MRVTLIRSLYLAAMGGLFVVLSTQAGNLTPDANFRPPSFARLFPPQRALLLSDGKYFLFFDPDTVTDQHTGAITRFLANGAVDPTFNFDRTYRFARAVAPTSNGQYYVAAAQYVYGAQQAEQVLRVNSDGSIDPSFTPATLDNPAAFAWSITPQPDGTILVIGSFTAISGTPRSSIARLLPNGTVDATFVPPAIAGGGVYSLAVQPDGKILVAGSFSFVGGSANPGITRLNLDGSRDLSFQPTGFARGSSTARIRGLFVQSDSKIVMSGNFRITSSTRAALLRLESNGAADTTFTTVTNLTTSQTGREFVVQSDGKFVVVVSNSVYRFEANGALDSSFHQPTVVDTTADPAGFPGTPVTLNLLPDGRFLLGGIFTDVDPPSLPGNAHYGVARLNADGTLDPSLTSIHRTGNETAPSSFSRLPDGSTFVAFADNIDPALPYNFGRLLPNGSRDPNFTLSSSNPNSFLSGGFKARGVEPLPDGMFFVFGVKPDFSSTFGRVLASGAEDTTFATSVVPPIARATATLDGKIILSSGNDVQVAVVGAICVRLQANGQPDNSFALAGSIPAAQIVRDTSGSNRIFQVNPGNRVLAVQTDGKILFEYFATDNLFHLVRLNADGSIDGSFAAATFSPFDPSLDFPVIFDPLLGITYQPTDGVWTASLPVLDAQTQSDGRIVLAGQFTSYNGTMARGLVRLQADGTVDNTFNSGGGAQWTQTTETSTFFPRVDDIELQGDGDFLISGTFEAFNGVAAPGIASLNPDGSVDNLFLAPALRDKYSRVASTLALQPDGSFLLSGPFNFAGETTPRSLVRLISPQPNVGNISTRLGVGTDENVLIEGFIVQGPAGSSKKLMVRAIGPSLGQFGIADALANPTLEIHDASGATVAANNDWRTTQIGGLVTGNQFAEINGTGLAPGNDLESAIIASLEPGSYTAVVRGAGNTAGTGVVDAFDLSTGSAAQLVNIATRGLVQPDDGLMIAGFIVQNGAVNVVVRAIGPSLVQFGISNALPDTTLQLRDQQGAIVLENDNWRTSQQQELEGLGLQPTHDLEAALVATIQPGQYTAQVRGKGQASGIGVVQVYFVQ